MPFDCLRIIMNQRSSMSHPLNQSKAGLRPKEYWRLWVLDAVLVSAGMWFFLATRYGTFEFFGKALAMAVLPFIAIMILVGGGGSTIFALTKVWIEKRSLNRPTALALLIGSAFMVALPLVLLGTWKSPGYRLGYICLGKAPVVARHVRVTGYSTFLHEEWLAVFNVNQAAFQKFVTEAQLKPVPDYEVNAALEHSALRKTGTYESIPPSDQPDCFRRVFNERVEHLRGRVYARFYPATSTAVVLREYHD